jgi:hypothetical protein
MDLQLLANKLHRKSPRVQFASGDYRFRFWQLARCINLASLVDISRKDEMKNLADVIQPTIGIFYQWFCLTTSFNSRKEKLPAKNYDYSPSLKR